MTLARGSATNGAWHASLSGVGSGCHRYFFAFKDSNGRIGILDERCPHRLATLFWGRNEEAGLRCVYVKVLSGNAPPAYSVVPFSASAYTMSSAPGFQVVALLTFTVASSAAM